MTIYFGENIKKLRKEKELTQETFADFLGVSFRAVSK
jgi:transcriptional regulator with XRE-family HTH domain